MTQHEALYIVCAAASERARELSERSDDEEVQAIDAALDVLSRNVLRVYGLWSNRS